MKSDLINTALGGYQLLKEIGSGSCGTVYLAENLVSGERFALKTFPAKGSLAERELHAVRLFQKIEHPNLIRIHHVGQTGDLLFYTMDWCESSLAERKIPPADLLPMARKLTGALAELHQHGLIHRDIKPDNIFFRNGEIVLGDIGLVTRGETATFAGSPGFLAPALLRGQTAPNEYTDCYALAKTLYCALSGQDPGKYPFYDGELSEAASLILRAVIAVCGDEPEIHNTAELLNFLAGQTTPPAPRRRSRKYLWAAGLTAALISVLLLIRHYTSPAPAVPEKPAEPVPVKPGKTAPAQTGSKSSVKQKADPLPADRELIHSERAKKSADSFRRETEAEIRETQQWNDHLDRIRKHDQGKTYKRQYVAYLTEQNEKTVRKIWNSDPETAKKNLDKLSESKRIHNQIAASGISAENLKIQDPELKKHWMAAGLDWEQDRKWKVLEELLRREKAGTPPEEALKQMAKSDRFLQFFGVEQREWLNSRKEARLIRNRKNAKLQQEYRRSTEKYVQQRDAFLDWYKRMTETAGK